MIAPYQNWKSKWRRARAARGVTPLTSSQMLHAENFVGFDFLDTWKIEEGETTPYLLTFTVQKTGYELWLEDNGLPTHHRPLALLQAQVGGVGAIDSSRV